MNDIATIAAVARASLARHELAKSAPQMGLIIQESETLAQPVLIARVGIRANAVCRCRLLEGSEFLPQLRDFAVGKPHRCVVNHFQRLFNRSSSCG